MPFESSASSLSITSPPVAGSRARSFMVYIDDASAQCYYQTLRPQHVRITRTTQTTARRDEENKENIPPYPHFPASPSHGKKKKSSLQKGSTRTPFAVKPIRKTSRRISKDPEYKMARELVAAKERQARIADQKAKDLTQMPLADVSMGYILEMPQTTRFTVICEEDVI